MGTAVLDLDGRRLLLGLQWRQHDELPARAELARRARQLGRWVLLRQTRLGVWQSGYAAELPAGVTLKNGESLAALLADLMHEHYLGIFDLGDGRYWMLAVGEDHVIHPDGDIAGSLEEIESACARLQRMGSWTIENWDLQGLRSRLADVHIPVAQLRDFSDSRRRRWRIVAGLTLVLILGAWSGHAYWKHRQQQREAALQAAKPKRPPPPPPWAVLPDSQVVLDACASAWSQQALSSQGWMLRDWTCTVRSGRIRLSLNWDEAGGRMSAAPGLLARNARSAASDVDAGSLRTGSPDVPVDGPTAMRELWDLQPLFMVRPGLGSSPVQIQLESTAPPWALDWKAALLHVAGLRISSLHWSRGAQWVATAQLFTRSP